MDSVCLVLANKVVVSTFKFHFVLTLTTLHFLATTAYMQASACAGIFKPGPSPPLKALLIVAALGVASIAFMNFSLQHNTVGFYQMTKLLCIPTIVAISRFANAATFSRKIYLTLALVCLGVGVSTVTDINFNALGTVFGALAVVSTSQFQIWYHQSQPSPTLYSVRIPLTDGLQARIQAKGVEARPNPNHTRAYAVPAGNLFSPCRDF